MADPLEAGSFHSIETSSGWTAVTEIESGTAGLSDSVLNSREFHSDFSDPEFIVRMWILYRRPDFKPFKVHSRAMICSLEEWN